MSKTLRILIALLAIVAGGYLTLVVVGIILKLIIAVCALALTSIILLKSDNSKKGERT